MIDWKDHGGGDMRATINGVSVAYKHVDRRVDPYIAAWFDDDGKVHTGLFSTSARAKSWLTKKANEFAAGRRRP